MVFHHEFINIIDMLYICRYAFEVQGTNPSCSCNYACSFSLGKTSDEISNEALEASINFVEVCIQHAAYLAGRGNIEDAIDSFVKMLSGRLNCYG